MSLTCQQSSLQQAKIDMTLLSGDIENAHKNTIFVHVKTTYTYCSHRHNNFLGHQARYT